MKAKTALIAFLLFLFCFSFAKSAFAADILINEFIPNPGTGNSEWVEFYNTTNSTVDLSDYFFDDDTNFDSDSGSSTKVALSGILQAAQTCFWELSSYLNNNGDYPTLFKMGNSTPLDAYNYSSSSAGLSYVRIPDGGEWNLNQTPSKSSNRCIDSAPTPTPTQGPTGAPTSTPTPLPTPSKTPTPKPSPTPIKSLTPTKESQKNENLSSSVLGSSTQNDTSTANEPSKQTRIQAPSIGSLVSIFFIIMGIIFAALCGIVFAWPHRHRLIEKFRK